MSTALLVEYYDELPEPREGNLKSWEARFRKALEKFREKAAARYTEGTLHRPTTIKDRCKPRNLSER